MPDTFDVILPDGMPLKGIPIGTTKDQVMAKAKANGYNFDAPSGKTPSGYPMGTEAPGSGEPGYLRKNTYAGNMLTGAEESGVNIMQGSRWLGEKLYGANPHDEAEKSAFDAANKNLEGKEGSGAGNFVARMAGDPLNYALGPTSAEGVESAVKAVYKAAGFGVPAATRANADIAKTLLKAGHSPEKAVEMLKAGKEAGQTVGEATKNPKLLGEERKISGMNNPGGETVRTHAAARVNPNNPSSMPGKLKAAAKPMLEAKTKASNEMGEAARKGPKYPVDMRSIAKSLAIDSKKVLPGTPAANTMQKIDGWIKEANKRGNTFEAWHDVKQAIGSLRESSDPMASAAEKMDSAMLSSYYNKINKVLRGEAPGVPVGLQAQSKIYAKANDTFRENIAGDMIERALNAMPTGGTPNASLQYLYKNLAGSPAAQEELFGHMPPAQRQGVMTLLKAINESGRAGVSDIVKSGEEGSPSFPLSASQAIGKMKDWMIDRIKRKDYDAIGKALTNPDIPEIQKFLGIKPVTVGKTADQALGSTSSTITKAIGQ